MSIRVGFDVDGVIANFNKTFRETAAEDRRGALDATTDRIRPDARWLPTR